MSKKACLALDFDDVLVPFLKAFLEFYRHKYGTHLKFEDIFSFELHKVFGGSKSQMTDMVVEFYDSEEHLKIESEPGVVDAIAELRKKFHLPIVTSRPHNVRKQTEALIGKNFSNWLPEIHFVNTYVSCNLSHEMKTKCKSEVCLRLGARLLIEDSISNVKVVAEKGIPVFMLDRPWNKGYKQDRVTRVYSWSEILSRIDDMKLCLSI